MAKYTGKELAVKREIDRINRQIRQAYTKFGKESRLAQQYETLLYGGNRGGETVSQMRGKGFEGVRYTKEGIPQISASKWAIWDFANISAYEKQLKILGKQQTVKSTQQAMIKAFEKRTGQTVKGRSAMQAALEEEIKRYQETEKTFTAQLAKLYEIERKRGVKLKAHEDIKALSKGRWTSDSDMQKMQEIVQKAIEDENAEIIKDKFGENQW